MNNSASDLTAAHVSTNERLMELTANVVSAYVGNHVVPASELPSLIASTYQALGSQAVEAVEAPVEKPVPKVAIKKSVHDDYLICLEDGGTYKSLKRHLMTKYSMTPDEYRAKWGLPDDYPMVAPNYAAQRSQLAKNMGLGQSRRGPAKTARTRVA